jgi:hypothetical protein
MIPSALASGSHILRDEAPFHELTNQTSSARGSLCDVLNNWRKKKPESENSAIAPKILLVQIVTRKINNTAKQ